MTTIQAHMIHDSDGQLSRVTVNDDDAQMAQAEGKCVTTNATAEEIFDAFMPTLPLRLMDDAAWQHLAPWLKSEADQIAKNTGNPKDDGFPYQPGTMLFNPPAPDLPEPLFDLYADTLEQVFSVRHDLHAFIALAEIGFARQAGRKVNESLFTAETLQMSWEAFFDDPFDEVEEQATRAEIFAEEVATQNASERSAYGDSAPGSLRTELIARLMAKELAYALEQYPEEKKTTSLSLS